MDLGAFGNYSYETFDSARPSPRFDIADVDRSLFAYLDCLNNSYADYAARVDGADVSTTFDHLVMHTPFAGLVKAAHRKLMKDEGLTLASLLDSGSVTEPGRVGLFSYGSGCSSEFFSGVVDADAAAVVSAMNIDTHLRNRAEITFAEYTDLLEENLKCLVPAQDRVIDVGRWDAIADRAGDRKETLTFTEVRNYHRRYEWR